MFSRYYVPSCFGLIALALLVVCGPLPGHTLLDASLIWFPH